MREATSETTISSYFHLANPNKKWYNNKRIIILNFWILLLLITSSTNAYDGTIMNSLHTLPQWASYFNNPTRRKMDFINTVQSIGSLTAFPISPYVADGLGRRTSIFIGALIMCFATAVQTSATSLEMFIGARFLIGFGLTFAATAAPILVAEIAYPAHRAPLTSAYNALWYSGAILAAWSTLGAAKIQTSWAWRLPSIFQIIFPALQVALIWFGPESPRWLISKNRNAEALKTLAYYHADSNKDDPLVRFEYDEIMTAIDVKQEDATKFGWKTLFTLQNRKRVYILLVLAFSMQWSTYPLNNAFITIGITNYNAQLIINGILQGWNLLWALFASSLVDKVGRRTLFLTSALGMIVAFSLETACSTVYTMTGNQVSAYALVASIFIFYAFYDIAFIPLLVSYPVEIFPYPLRAKGLAFFNFALSLSFILNQYVHSPFGLGAISLLSSIVCIIMLAGQGSFLWLHIVETKNHTLEETATHFDGDSVEIGSIQISTGV